MMHRVANTITQRDKTLHARQRRLLSHGFSDAALRNFEEAIAAHVNNFCHHLIEDERQSGEVGSIMGEREWSSTKDMALWCESTCLPVQILLPIIELIMLLSSLRSWLSRF